MIARMTIVVLLTLAASGLMPWRVVCAADCRLRCCAPEAETAGACQPAEAARADGGCCGPGACCEEPADQTAERDARPCDCTDAADDSPSPPCCCAFVPLNRCEGCDLLCLFVWAPWKGSPVQDALRGLDAALFAAATVDADRAGPIAPARALRADPPWKPGGVRLLNSICVRTI